MVDDGRDPDVVGYEWAAWWALQGDEPLSRVKECADHLEVKLGYLAASLHDRGDSEGAAIVSAAHLFMIAFAELLDENGTSQFKAAISHRKRGKPINKAERARIGHRAAGIVRRLVGEGVKQEAALEEAKVKTGLSRAEIMAWLKVDRSWMRAAQAGFAGAKLPPMPNSVAKLLKPYMRPDDYSRNNQD